MTTITNPTITTNDVIPVADDNVGDRLREDLGDITLLAESIERFGLIQPIVVDADNLLAAGGRRLAAVQHLGWSEVSVRRYGTLTAHERLDIELEENEGRKELSVYERAKAIARLAVLARAVAAEEAVDPKCVESAQQDRVQPGSLRDLQRRLNISEATIRAAERHVSAVAFYPELAPLPQYRVFELADLLDRLPVEERPAYQQRIGDVESLSGYTLKRDIEDRLRELKQRRPKRKQQSQPDTATPLDVDPLVATMGPTAAAMFRAGVTPTPAQLLASGAAAPGAPLTPEEEENLGRQHMRRAFAEARDRFWDILQIRPRALRKALEPTDMREVREFIDKLRPWADEWVEVLR